MIITNLCSFMYNVTERLGLCYLTSNLNPLSANPTKWSDTLKQYVGNLRTDCLSVCDDFVKLVLKGLKNKYNGHTLNSQ